MQVIIESDDKKSFLYFESFEREFERYPSVSLSITVQDGEFRGHHNEVCFELDAMIDFIRQLKELEMTRKGSATLNSMSPDEFELKIETYNSSGHMILKYKILKYNHHLFGNTVSLIGGFELDATGLRNVIAECSKIVNFN